MALLHIPLDRIAEPDLVRLIDTGAAESAVIDYKRSTYGGSENDRAEFLRDITSFANTLGGDLVIGMAETAGAPVEVTALPGDADAEVRRLEGIARAGVEPRLNGLAFKIVPISSGGFVLIVRVRRSFIPPHRISYRNSNRFWARGSAGKYEPNVEELRRLFNDAPQLAERIRSFRTDRVLKLTAGETPVPMSAGTKLVLHVVPLPAFADGRLADVVDIVARGTHLPLPLSGQAGGNRTAVNLDGLINYLEYEGIRRRSYAQLFRSGVIEGAIDLPKEENGASYFVGPELANMLVAGIKQYSAVLESLDTGAPVYAFISFCDATGSRMRYGYAGSHAFYEAGPFAREIIALPELLIDPSLGDVPTLLRPIFNTLWNAYGVPQCDMYDGAGAWTGTA